MRTRSGEGWGQLPRKIAKGLARTMLGSNEGQIVWSIVYKTLAFNKTKDRVPGSQFQDLTGIDKRNLYRAINSLLKKGIIIKEGFVYGLNIDFFEDKKVSLDTSEDKIVSLDHKKVSLDTQKVYQVTHSRDLLIRTNQERGFIKPTEEKRERKIPEGLKQLRKDIKNFPGLKR